MIDRLTRLVAPLGSRPALLVLPVLAGLLGVAAGATLAYVPDTAIVEALSRYEPSVVTRVYDEDGMQFAEWLQQRREVVSFPEISPYMVQAVVAAEDARFFKHMGIDPPAIFRAVLANLRAGGFEEGFSTITMQIPRNLDRYLGGDTWLPKDKSIERKLREVVYAVQIERHYTKEQIFAIYANQIFMGVDVYGFQAAARFYFGKPIAEVTLPEAALLAGIIQIPNYFNPYRNPERAVNKRNIVLERMLREGYITAEQAAEAKASPLVLAGDTRKRDLGSYFTEEIRKQLIKRYGVDGIYRSGLRVNTTLNRSLQSAAELALDRGLRQVDRRQGWRGAAINLLEAGPAPEGEPAGGIDRPSVDDWEDPSWEGIEPDDIVPGVVMQVSDAAARVRIGERVIEITPGQAEWTNRKRMGQLVRAGDIVEIWIKSIADDGTWEVELDQEPDIQGAILVVENHTGEVKALVGGRGFDDSEFNRATQAVRQTGSIFKPFVYATAVSLGITPSELFVDQPATFRDPTTRQPYQPQNFANEYIGITSMAEALTKSRNVPTVKLQERIGVENVIDMARRFGLTAPFGPYLSLGLGVMDISVWEIVRGYTVFPNQGTLVEPHLVRDVYDRRGRLLERFERSARQVMNSDEAYVMARILAAGVQRPIGTGHAAAPLAADLGMMLGGKSGTTDDRTDVWYVGFSPHHTVGVWIGRDQKERIGRRETGSRAALPIWIEVMRAAEQGQEPGVFLEPANIEIRRVDPYTGLLHGPFCREGVELAYIAGTGPSRVCGRTEHNILELPAYQQAYFVSNGRIDTGGG